MSIWREAETPSGASPGAALPGLMMAGQKVAGLYRQIRQSILIFRNSEHSIIQMIRPASFIPSGDTRMRVVLERCTAIILRQAFNCPLMN